jgi:hypothetical protein
LEDLQKSAVAAERKYNLIVNPRVSPADGFALMQNYPNPANQNTTIEFSIPKESLTNLSLYNVLGKRVKNILNETLLDGTYRINVDLQDLKSGIYFYRLNYDNKMRSLKMLVVK